MKKITVYGPGCARCKQAEEVARRVIAETGADVVVEKVTDLQAMVKAGIMATPAVAVDGVTKATGRVPKAEELRQWIAG
jgi:small redox-active disulfide protein 2